MCLAVHEERRMVINRVLFCSVVALVLGGMGTAIPLEDFYPFGPTADGRDLFLPANDDGSSVPIVLNRPFPFFGSRHTSLIVSKNE